METEGWKVVEAGVKKTKLTSEQSPYSTCNLLGIESKLNYLHFKKLV